MGPERLELEAERREAKALLFRDILERRALSCVFQPILDFHTRSILGYEALIRGPKNSLFQSPVDLFNAAEDSGSLAQLSVICVNTVLNHFSALRLPGKLFLNISPHLVTQPGFDPDRASRNLKRLGLKAEQVIIELTEHHPMFDFADIQKALTLYRAMGFKVAIDDLGEGFSSLRLWSELKPEFVKADKHFVNGIAGDAVKMQFLKAIQQIAESCGTRIVAEGIETEADFQIVRELGVSCGQGFLIGRPEEKPATTLSPEISRLLSDQRVPVPPILRHRQALTIEARQFLRDAVTVAPIDSVRQVIALFESAPNRYAIPVVEAERPIGLIARRHVRFIKTLADSQSAEFDKTARDIMNVGPLIVDQSITLMQLAGLLADSTPQHLADGFIITDEGRYLGMGAATDVMRMLTDVHLTAARYTNPLTFLPGPVPTNQHIETLLKRERPFIACLAEIDPMKGFNDAYGFQKGDELIRLAGESLQAYLDDRHDFVGHVYGNRFVLLIQSADWQERLDKALRQFDRKLMKLLSEDVVARGNFVWKGRGGDEIRPLPRLALGAVPITPERVESRHQVMAAIRESVAAAKTAPGSHVHLADPSPGRGVTEAA